jgi:hypothetical protein
MKWRVSLLAAIFCILSASIMLAQDTRSTIKGHVSDATGALVPGAAVTVRNMDTGEFTNVRSNTDGEYTVPFLEAGRYEVTANQPSFRTYDHSGLVLATEQTLVENITLIVGDVSETYTVSSSASLVDTATAETGQTLTAEEVEDLPSNGRSPIGFVRDEYGVVSKGKHSQAQVTPFDNSAASDFAIGGGASQSNEVLLNGVPNMQDSSRLPAFSPLLDATDAVHVDVFTSDASFGDTIGGVVNITTKPGTNQFHGSGSEYYSGSRPFTAEPYFTTPGSTVASTHFNQFGGTIGGPVYIPHLYNGHNRVFFEYAYEGYLGAIPATTIASVPTAAERTGDFSALLAISPNYQLYNPYNVTATTTGGKTTYTRAKIPNNVLSQATGGTQSLTINPIAAKYLALFPQPNYNGPSTKPDGTNNFFADDPTANNYKSNALRIDTVISQSNKLFGELHRSTSFVDQSNVFNSFATGTSAETLYWGGSIDDTHTFNGTTFLNTRLGFTRSVTSTGEPSSLGTDPSTFGFPSYISSTSQTHALPKLTFSDTDVPSISAAIASIPIFDDIQFFASFNKSIGRHSIKIGPDIRLNKDSVFSPSGSANANGTFGFTTSATDFVTSGTTGAVQPFGSSFALLALGLPTGGSLDVNERFQYNNWYNGFFVQDDWNVLSNLTASLGFRVEHEIPINESQNRMTLAWNSTTVNGASAAAAANYAKTPALVPASQFVSSGGLYYANSEVRHAYHPPFAYFSPRIGLAYSPDATHGTTAIRVGWGIFENPFNDFYQSQTYGYSQTTSMIPSTNANQTVATTLSDPFPQAATATSPANPIQQPAGSANGINTNLGSKMVFYGQTKQSYAMRTSLDIQQQFGKNWLLDIGAINTHEVHLSYSNALNNGSGSAPVSYLSQSRYYDPVLSPEYGASVANPYFGTMAGLGPAATASLNTSKTVAQSGLLWPYAEYSSVTQQLIPGASGEYNALQARLEKRLADGFNINVDYTWSRSLGAQSQLNAGGPLWYGETSSDFPHSLHVTSIYQLPVGKGKLFLGDPNRIVDEALGGWEVSGVWSFDSGTPYGWGNVIYNGDWHDIANKPHTPHGLAFNTSLFDTATCTVSVSPCPTADQVQPNAYNYRTFPSSAWRADVTDNFDFSVLKNFHVYDRVVVQPRIDAFNAFNRAQFSAPNLSPTSAAFGTISGQANTSRQLQGGLHILF